MPGAIIAFDQARPGPTTSTGSPGVARNDLWVGWLVTGRITTSGNTSPEWTLLDKPPGSTVTLAGATSLSCTFTPDLPGSYRIQLQVNGGGAGNVQILIAACTFDVAGHLTLRGWRIPALSELPTENNFSGQTRGWDEAVRQIFTEMQTTLLSGVARIAAPDANYTAQPADLANGFLCNTGTTPFTADRNLVLPAVTDGAAYVKYVINRDAAFNWVATTGSGTTFAVPATTMLPVLVDALGVHPMGIDVTYP